MLEKIMWFQETFVRILLTKGQLNNHNGYPELCISICLIYRIRFLFLSTSESSFGRFYPRNKTVTWGSNWIWLYPHCLPIFPPHCVYRVCACVSFWKAYDFCGKTTKRILSCMYTIFLLCQSCLCIMCFGKVLGIGIIWSTRSKWLFLQSQMC